MMSQEEKNKLEEMKKDLLAWGALTEESYNILMEGK